MAHKKFTAREKRKGRIRKNIFGTISKPRLTVFRSNRHLYAQIIDDGEGKTLTSASTLKSHVRPTKTAAKELGRELAEKGLAQKIERVVFDRNGYLYHGLIKEMADAARAVGLKF